MTGKTKAQLQGDLDSIAERALTVRINLTDALTSIEDIISLATNAGRTDVVRAAQAVKSSTRAAAKKFNDEVAKTDGDPTKMDSIVLDSADKAADEAQTELRGLYNKLKEQVDGIDENVKGIKDNIKLWGFGTKRNQDGLPIPKKDSWAAAVEENLTELDNSNAAWGFGTERDATGKTVPVENTWAAWVTGDVVKHNETLYGPDGKSGLVKDVADVKMMIEQATSKTRAPLWVFIAAVVALIVFIWVLIAGGGAIWASVSAGAILLVGLALYTFPFPFPFKNRNHNRPAV